MTMDAYAAPDRKPPTGIEVMGYITRYLDYFAVWPNQDTRNTVALWVMHSHARSEKGVLVFPSSPRLWFQSGQPGSGKSQAMKVVSRICPEGRIITQPSEPAVAHYVGTKHATLFFEEIDELFGQGGRKSAVKAILNDGYTPDGIWPRVRNNDVMELPTFGAAGFAGLDKVETGTNGLMTAFLTRCIRVRMRRAPDDYRAPRFGKDEKDTADKLRDLITAWTSSVLDELADTIPEMPEGVGNRTAELWEPLIVCADTVGEAWPTLARKACERLTKIGTSPDDAIEIAADLDALMSGWSETSNALAELPENDETDSLSEAPESTLPTDTRGKILAVLQESGEALAGNVAAERAGIEYGTFRVTAMRMRDDGQLIQPQRSYWDIAKRNARFSVRDNRAH